MIVVTLGLAESFDAQTFRGERGTVRDRIGRIESIG
jgi:hypothetical protein